MDLRIYIVQLDFYDHFLIHQTQLSIHRMKVSFYGQRRQDLHAIWQKR